MNETNLIVEFVQDEDKQSWAVADTFNWWVSSQAKDGKSLVIQLDFGEEAPLISTSGYFDELEISFPNTTDIWWAINGSAIDPWLLNDTLPL